MTDATTPRRHRRAGGEQLSLLPPSDAHIRFRLSKATRERGLRHVAELREMLAQREAERAPENLHRLPPRHAHHDEAA